jgi:hypothetical protein
MRRIAIGAAGLALAMLPAMNASADNEPSTYQQIRTQLYQCNLDINWHQLSSDRRAECNDLFRKYVMFTDPKQNSSVFLHCRSSSDCIPTPEGEPDAAGPIPDGMDVYDVQPTPERSKAKKAKKAARAAHRHRR